MTEIRWHGRGGQGAFTASRILGAAASLFEGKHALAFPSFGPERRGAPVVAYTKIDVEKIRDRSEIKSCDYMIVLDESLLNEYLIKDLKDGGKLIVNTRFPEKYREVLDCDFVAVDATAIAMDILKRPVTNTAMLGALLGVSGIVSLESGIDALGYSLPDAIVKRNTEVMKSAYFKVKESAR
jgi:pyruvate ferredoxin oxidoreductase gamma subunit